MSRKLILMRHAKSSWDHPGLKDHARPLNPRGTRSAAHLGDWLRANGHIPDEVLCSTSQRTRETLAGLALPPTAKTRFLDQLYHAEPEQMADCLRQATGPCVLIIAHNPGIGDWAQELAHPHPDHPRFADYPTGATTVLTTSLPWAKAGQMEPLEFIIPRELG